MGRLRTMPGVVAAAYGFGGGDVMTVEIRGKPSEENSRAQVQTASDGYFATLHIPLLKGRAISEEDFKLARNVAVINRLFATRYFPGEDPLGREITVKGMASPPYSVKSPSFEIVGVVGDFRFSGLDQPSQPELYVPLSVVGFSRSSFLIRTATAPGLLLNPLRREVAAVDKELPVQAEPLEDMMNQWLTEPRFVVTLMSVFAALGLTLVLVGVYGVLSYSVTQRTREIGIRMALGAQVADVLRMLLGSGLRWLLIGIGLGVPASVGLAKALQNRIWGLKAADPLTLVIVAIFVTAAGLAACYIPARRATKVDPMAALRYE
jgi:putative ABC transport system permease protein